MVVTLAKVCQVPGGCVNVKATTTEQLGFTGRGEGISAHAVVLMATNDS
jgi:2-C-methyl-D-erythritol 2,4-cyclodiphosphate synthase